MGNSEAKRQAQIEVRTQALQVLNVETALLSVLRQLDRFDRVTEEGANRTPSVRPNLGGDENHTTIEDNQMALTAKLMCLQGILKVYDRKILNENCARNICHWYNNRKGKCSQTIVQAVRDCALTCQVNYQGVLTSPTTPPLSDELNTFARGLALACADFHGKQEKVEAKPEAYMQKVNKKSTEVKEQVPDFNIEQFIADLDKALESFPVEIPSDVMPVPQIPGAALTPASQVPCRGNKCMHETQGDNPNESDLPQEPKTGSELTIGEPSD